MRIAFFDLSALRIKRLLRKKTGSMEVQVGVEVAHVRLVDGGSEALWNMATAEGFSDDHCILDFGQSVVGALAGAGLGLLDAQFLQKPGRGVVDVLAAVVGVKAQERDGNALSIASMTGSKKASLIRSVQATTSHCVTQSTALM